MMQRRVTLRAGAPLLDVSGTVYAAAHEGMQVDIVGDVHSMNSVLLYPILIDLGWYDVIAAGGFEPMPVAYVSTADVLS
jgi:hypothetical protein